MPDTTNDMDPHVATMWSREDRDLLIELKTRMEGVGLTLEKLEKTIASREGDHESRIRSLERRQWFVAGGSTTLATAASYLLGLLFK